MLSQHRTLLDSSALAQAVAVSDGAPIVVGLSGGGDSMALLALLREKLGAPALSAAIVDHGLRQDSRQEAEAAAGAAEAMGVRARVTVLSWAAGARRAQAHTRAARHKALCAAAQEIGARVIALGHSADDQAETVWMRAGRGSDWRGLAGMRALAPSPIWPEGRGLLLLRPLLGTRRAQLREVLRARALNWIEDVSNANPVYARVRARCELADLEEAGFDPMRLARVAGRLQPPAARIDGAAWALIGEAGGFDRGTAWLAWDACRSGQVGARAVWALIAAAGGAAQPAPGRAVSDLLERLGAGEAAAGTLGGAVVRRVRAGTQVRFDRDPGGLKGRANGALGVAALDLPVGELAVWDGRIAFRAQSPGLRVAAPSGAKGQFCVVCDGGSVAEFDAHAPDLAGGQWLLEARAAQLLGACDFLRGVHPALNSVMA